MNFKTLMCVSLICGLTLAQDYGIPDLRDIPGIPDLRDIPGIPDIRDIPRIPSIPHIPDGEGSFRETQPPSSADPQFLRREISALSERLAAMETKLSERDRGMSLVEPRDTNMVVFSAVSGGDREGKAIGPFMTETTMIYSRVLTNIGNGYNKVTGVFTAPVAGIYYFTFYHHGGGSNPTSLLLTKNEEELVVMTHDHASTYDTADNGGNAVFIQLQQGDRICVRLGARTSVWGNRVITTFSGFLLGKV